jgi:hypothetical protein
MGVSPGGGGFSGNSTDFWSLFLKTHLYRDMKTFMQFLEGYDQESPIKVGDKVAFALDYLRELQIGRPPLPPELEQAKGVVTDLSYHHIGPGVYNVWVATVKWDIPEVNSSKDRVYVDHLVKLDGSLQRDPNGSGRRPPDRLFDPYAPHKGGWDD